VVEYRVRVQALGAAVVIALAIVASIVTSAIVASRAYVERPAAAAAAAQDVTVKGKATRRVLSDRAVWRVRVHAGGESLQEAYGVLEESTARVRAFVDEAGFAAGEWSLSAISTDTHYVRDAKGNQTRNVAGYTLSQTLGVDTAEVEKVRRAASAVTALIKDGVEVISQAPEYVYTRVGEVKQEIIEAATADARDRARRMVEASGGSLGPVRDVRQGVIQITSPHSTQVSSYGIYDTSTIAKDVSVVVTAIFGVRSD
jgi:hypothetical protein